MKHQRLRWNADLRFSNKPALSVSCCISVPDAYSKEMMEFGLKSAGQNQNFKLYYWVLSLTHHVAQNKLVAGRAERLSCFKRIDYVYKNINDLKMNFCIMWIYNFCKCEEVMLSDFGRDTESSSLFGKKITFLLLAQYDVPHQLSPNKIITQS